MLHALALLFCAFMGGTTSSYLQRDPGAAGAGERRPARRRTRSSRRRVAAQAAEPARAGGGAGAAARERGALPPAAGAHPGRRGHHPGRPLAYANEVMARHARRPTRGRAAWAPTSASSSCRRTGASWRSATARGSRARRCRAGWRPACARARASLLRVHVRAGSLQFEGKRSVIATVRDVTRERRWSRRSRTTPSAWPRSTRSRTPSTRASPSRTSSRWPPRRRGASCPSTG